MMINHCLDDIWVSHLCKSQTTPTILHNEECYSLSYDKLDFCARGGKIKRWYVVVRYVWPNLYYGYSIMKENSATIHVTCDHFRDMTQLTLASKLGFHWQMTHVEYANDVVHLHNID